MVHQRPDSPPAQARAVASPRIPALSLGELVPAEGADLVPGDEREAEILQVRGVSELDWTRVTLRECQVEAVGVEQLGLDRARVLVCRLRELEVTALVGRDGTWRNVAIDGGRIPALDLAGSIWDGVAVTGARLGYVNLRAATLTDVAFTDCRIESLDLGGASASRVRLHGCTVDELIVTRATLADVDLRGARIGRFEGATHLGGATISSHQLLDLAPALARAHAIAVDTPE